MTHSNNVLFNALPRAFELNDRTAFLIIDMQRDFIQDGGYGSYQCPSPAVFAKVSSITSTVKKVLDACRQSGVTVIHTREGHRPDMTDCFASKLLRQVTTNPKQHELCIGDQGPLGKLLVRNEYGHDIVDELTPLSSEYVLDKPAKGSFCNTDFYQVLTNAGITHIVLAGVTTECCVNTTFREANDRGFECCVLTDCTGGFDEGIVNSTIRNFSAFDGLLGYTSNSEAFLGACQTYTPKPKTSENPLAYCNLRPRYLKDPSIAKKYVSAPIINESDLPLLYGIPFSTSPEISNDSRAVKRLIKHGAVLLGSTDGHSLSSDCTFILTVDTEGSSASSEGYSISATKGSISTVGVDITCPSYDRITVLANEPEDSRLVWRLLVEYDEEDPNAIHYRSFPTPGIDYRGPAVARYKIGVVPEAFLKKLGSKTQESYQLFLDKIANLTNFSIYKIDMELWEQASSLSKIFHGQERIAHTGGVMPELKEFDLPGWKVAQLRQQWKEIMVKIDAEAPILSAVVLPLELSALTSIDNFCSANLNKQSVSIVSKAGMDWLVADIMELLA